MGNEHAIPHEKAALIFTEHDILFRRPAPHGVTYQYVTPATVRTAFAQEPLDMGWLHPNVRRAGWGRRGRWFALHFSPAVHTMQILKEGQRERKLKVPMPGLVFIAYGSAYHIAAVKEAQLTDQTILFEAPMPNHAGLNSICWGYGKKSVPQATGDILGEVWALLWDSTFNEHSAEGKSQAYPQNILDQLIALDGQPEYPIDDLITTRQTFGSALTTILDGRIN